MATNNSINLKSSGIAIYDSGTGIFSATTITEHSALVGGASNAITSVAMTDGQLLIGSTGADPVAATITAGVGIGVTSAAGAITIFASGAGTGWSVKTDDAQMVVNNSYGSNKDGAIAFTLPATAAVGDTVEIVGMQGSWNIVQGALQYIQIGSTTSTIGAGGSIASTNAFDAIQLVCLEEDVGFFTRSIIGNCTIV